MPRLAGTAQDYYAFGMEMPGRSFTQLSSNYRYGFNGKENDNEVKGEGNQQDYGMRIYDPRLGRFLSVDPLTPKYPELTPYQFASNSPIAGIDLDGLEYSPAGKVGIFARDNTAVKLYHISPVIIQQQKADAPMVRFNKQVQRLNNRAPESVVNANIALFQKNVSDPDNIGGAAAYGISKDVKNSRDAYRNGD